MQSQSNTNTTSSSMSFTGQTFGRKPNGDTFCVEKDQIVPEFKDFKYRFRKCFNRGENHLDYIESFDSDIHTDHIVSRSRTHFRREIFKHLRNGDWGGVMGVLKEYDGPDGVKKMASEDFRFHICRPKDKYSPLKSLDGLALVCRHGYLDCIPPVLRMEGQDLSVAEVQDALLEAVRTAHRSCYRRLMERRLLQHDTFQTVYGKVIAAARFGQFSKLEKLLETIDIKEKDLLEKGVDLVNLLIMYGCPSSCLRIVLGQGVNAHSYDGNGMNPVSSAVLSQNIQCLAYLLIEMDDLSKTYDEDAYRYGKTALMFAASLKNTTCLEVLLKCCDEDYINFPTLSGWTALTFACLYGNTKSVRMLLDSGAHLEIFDEIENSIIVPTMKSGSTDCLSLVLSQLSDVYCRETIVGITDVKCLVQHVDCLSMFVQHFNFGVDTVFNNWQTLLTVAASKGYMDSVRWLLDKGAGIDVPNKYEMSPLMSASVLNRYEVLQFLIEKGATVDTKNTKGDDAGMACLLEYNLKCFNLLISAGVDLNRRSDTKRFSVFTLAMMMPRVTCLEMILTSGQIVQDGQLRQVHKDSMVRWTRKPNGITAKTLTFVMKQGLFDWSWLSSYTFRKILFSAVHSGICPGAVLYHYIKMSPLVLAFVLNEVALVKFCLANLYFFPEDYSVLCSNGIVRDLMKQRRQELPVGVTDKYGDQRKSADIENAQEYAQIPALLERVTLQPLSLQTWSFLVASKAISQTGPAHQRSQRVDALPLPDFYKTILKFETSLSKVCRTFWKDVDIGSPGDMIFRSTRTRRPQCSAQQAPHYCFNCYGLGVSFETLGIFPVRVARTDKHVAVYEDEYFYDTEDHDVSEDD